MSPFAPPGRSFRAPLRCGALLGLFVLVVCFSQNDAFAVSQKESRSCLESSSCYSATVLLQHSVQTSVEFTELDADSVRGDDLHRVARMNSTSDTRSELSLLSTIVEAAGPLFLEVEARWKRDVFDAPLVSAESLLEGIIRHQTDWMILVGAVVVLFLVDLLVVQPLQKHWEAGSNKAPGSNTGGHVAALTFWVLMGVAYNLIVYLRNGSEAGVQWCTGYILEWLLSLDNLFVFHLIFRTYNTPRELLHKALFIGIVGAVVFRMVFFMALTGLLRLFKWVRFFFGILLIYSGIQAARGDDEEEDVSNTIAVRMLKRCLGSHLMEGYDTQEHCLFVRGEDGRLKATLLVVVVFCLEMTDIFFAVDSVSAKVAQIPHFYISYSSSVIAIFGLRAMFFLVQDMVDSFDLMKYGLCFILVFIGIELMIADWVQLPAHVVCVVIVSVFLVAAAGSVAQQYIDSKMEKKEALIETPSASVCQA